MHYERDISASVESLILTSHFLWKIMLFAFGITPVELCFGKTLSDMQGIEDDDSNEATAIMNCAFRSLDFRAIWRNMGELYEAMARRCLRQTFKCPI